MERSVLSWACIFALVALPATGCSDESTAAGGTGGSGDTGGGSGLGGVGGSGDLCEGAEDCDDGNDCTEDVCNPEGRTCSSMAIADGTGCAGGACEAGQCALSGSVLPCSEQGIRNAIAAGGGPYTFDCDGTMPVVTEAEIVIDNDVELDGEGNLTVDGNEDHGVFFVAEGVTAGLRGVTVTGGRRPWHRQPRMVDVDEQHRVRQWDLSHRSLRRKHHDSEQHSLRSIVVWIRTGLRLSFGERRAQYHQQPY